MVYNQNVQQAIDSKTISFILENDIISITPIVGKGEVNRVYIVKLKDNQVLVRLNDREELGRFRKEGWCIDEANKKGIPGPTVIDIDEKNNTAYMVLDFIAGENGSEITANKEQIWFAIGSYARKIHSIPTSGFGEQMTTSGIFDDTLNRFITYNIDNLNANDPLLNRGIISESDSSSVKGIFSILLKKQLNIGLTHRDLSLANIIIENDTISLIDWGSAEVNIIPHVEILGILEDSLTENDPLFDFFLKGYGISRNEFSELRSELDAITLLIAIDKLRWAIDRKPDKIDEFSQKVKKLVRQI